MIDSKWYMEAEGQAERSVLAEISLSGMAAVVYIRPRNAARGPKHILLYMCVPFSADNGWHCLVGGVLQRRRGPGRVRLRTRRWDGCVKLCLLWTWSISPYLSLICHRGASPLSIIPHGSFKCNFKKPTKKVATVRNIHSCEGVLGVYPKFKELFGDG